MIDPGRLRHLVTLKRPGTRTPGQGGGYSQKMRPVVDAEVWAEIRPLQGNERQLAMQTKANATHRVFMRYRPDVTAYFELIHEGRTLKIVAPPIDPNEMHEDLELLVREET